MTRVRVALAQINVTVGALHANAERIRRAILAARERAAHFVVFPELAVTGYPPEDLLLKPSFIAENERLVATLASECRGIAAIVGYVAGGEDISNAAALLHDGRIASVYRKRYLPNYGVFDEFRYFQAGDEYPVYHFGPVKVGVNICEDIWYPAGPTDFQAFAGADIIFNLNASPYQMGKWRARERMLSTRANDSGVYVCYCNLVGGQDELVFDGGSMVFDPSGRLIARASTFEEDLLILDVRTEEVVRERLRDPRGRQNRGVLASEREQIRAVVVDTRPPAPLADLAQPTRIAHPQDIDEVYRALVLGVADYVRKNAFTDVVIGLSGGIDSALTATIAVDALGADHVIGVSLPSRYSSAGSRDDAADLAQRLGIRFLTIPIEGPFVALLDALADAFAGTQPTVAEENLQSRVRGALLMALSNKFGWLVLTTGNKSEMATGYSTLYGDMAGGFAVLKDVPKMLVYALAKRRNERSPVIPENSITKPPSAELRPNQKDEDSLPPYPILDAVLELYVEQDRAPQEIVEAGYDAATVARVARLVDQSEYKRRQSPPGVKVTMRAFGRDRRLPITNGYRPIVE